MSNYEQKIFEQVIDNYIKDTQNLSLENESKLNSINFKINSTNSSISEENTAKRTSENQKKKRESKSKAVLIEAEYHENLPKGWKKVVVQRTTGATAGKFDVYFFTPSGRKLRSKNEIKDYSDKHRLDLDLTNFGFSRPKRENKTNIKKIKNKVSVSTLLKEGDSSEAFESTVVRTEPLSNHIIDTSISDTFVNVDSIFTNIEDDLHSGADICDIPVNLPNTSFSKCSDIKEELELSTSSSCNDLDLEKKTHFGKTFKIERPLSFSCF